MSSSTPDERARRVASLLSSYYGAGGGASADGGATGGGTPRAAAGGGASTASGVGGQPMVNPSSSSTSSLSSLGTNGSVAPAPSPPVVYDEDHELFDVDAWLSHLLQRAPLSELLATHARLTREAKTLDSEMQSLVHENYARFIAATDTIRALRSGVATEAAPAAEKVRSALADAASRGQQLDERLRAHAERVSGISRVRDLLRAVSPAEIRAVAERVRKASREEMPEAAADSYQQAAPLLAAIERALSRSSTPSGSPLALAVAEARAAAAEAAAAIAASAVGKGEAEEERRQRSPPSRHRRRSPAEAAALCAALGAAPEGLASAVVSGSCSALEAAVAEGAAEAEAAVARLRELSPPAPLPDVASLVSELDARFFEALRDGAAEVEEAVGAVASSSGSLPSSCPPPSSRPSDERRLSSLRSPWQRASRSAVQSHLAQARSVLSSWVSAASEREASLRESRARTRLASGDGGEGDEDGGNEGDPWGVSRSAAALRALCSDATRAASLVCSRSSSSSEASLLASSLADRAAEAAEATARQHAAAALDAAVSSAARAVGGLGGDAPPSSLVAAGASLLDSGVRSAVAALGRYPSLVPALGGGSGGGGGDRATAQPPSTLADSVAAGAAAALAAALDSLEPRVREALAGEDDGDGATRAKKLLLAAALLRWAADASSPAAAEALSAAFAATRPLFDAEAASERLSGAAARALSDAAAAAGEKAAAAARAVVAEATSATTTSSPSASAAALADELEAAAALSEGLLPPGRAPGSSFSAPAFLGSVATAAAEALLSPSSGSSLLSPSSGSPTSSFPPLLVSDAAYLSGRLRALLPEGGGEKALELLSKIV